MSRKSEAESGIVPVSPPRQVASIPPQVNMA